MAYEIEKRSLFLDKADFEACERKVAALGTREASYIYRTFLYRKPEYLRIRLRLGRETAEITVKSGTYADAARLENENFIPLASLPSFVDEMKAKGFTECVSIAAQSNKYRCQGLEVSFNSMEHLGMIVEVEAITDDASQIPELEKKVVGLMKQLKLKELPAAEYQKMMDKMYATAMKPVGKQAFSL